MDVGSMWARTVCGDQLNQGVPPREQFPLGENSFLFVDKKAALDYRAPERALKERTKVSFAFASKSSATSTP